MSFRQFLWAGIGSRFCSGYKRFTRKTKVFGAWRLHIRPGVDHCSKAYTNCSWDTTPRIWKFLSTSQLYFNRPWFSGVSWQPKENGAVAWVVEQNTVIETANCGMQSAISATKRTMLPPFVKVRILFLILLLINLRTYRAKRTLMVKLLLSALILRLIQ